MTTNFVPDEALGRITQEIGLTGTTLPRSVLVEQDWPQVLIEDYDAKGRDQDRSNDDVVQAASGALTAQRWARTNQQAIRAVTRRVTTLEGQVVSFDGRITTNTAAISALSTRVTTLEGQIPQLQPQTGTAAPEGMVTSNLSRTYYQIDGMTTALFFNPMAGVNTGWVQITMT